MFWKRRKTKNNLHFNKKGFSLIEVLIAIAVLIVVTVPMAMNMISSSQINGKAKQVATSSDLTTSLMEIMQTVDLSDVLTEINGYDADEYGTKLPYLIKDNALKEYTIESTAEFLKKGEGDNIYFEPVTKSKNTADDAEATTSVVTRSTGDVIRAYFRGQKDNNYSFVLTGVENDEMNVDVLATITPQGDPTDIVNITSMAQTEVVFTRQTERMDEEIAAEFLASNNKYIALKKEVESVASRDLNWFMDNMKRTITIDLVQDTFTEAVTITIKATYTVDTEAAEGRIMKEADGTITKNLGSFSTNSTAEFARGVYIYYYPLENNNGSRDSFVINNKNELGAPIFLIAMADDSSTNVSEITNYNPHITVNELSNQVYQNPRTTVCSNIDDSLWVKKVTPTKNTTLTIKTIGNVTEQQTLYSITFKVYRHKDNAYDENGNFAPKEKDLLVETSGSFFDTSEKLDVGSDKTTGITSAPGIATAGKYSVVYNGVSQDGVYGTNVKWEGTTKAVNAGTYTAIATPLEGFSWADGSKAPKKITWVMERATTAVANPVYATYNGNVIRGIIGDFLELEGTYEAKDAGTYTAYVTPDSNHAWEDGTYTTRSIKWKINPRVVTIKWATGDGYDTWEYDGEFHYASCTLDGVLHGDDCYPTLENHAIQNVGSKIARVAGLSNKNYALPAYNTTHTIQVITMNSARYELVNGGILEYNGVTQSVVKSSVGVYFTGTTAEKNAGEYTMMAVLKDGYTWPDGSVDSKLVKWEITPRIAILKWGENTWTYDGLTHSTTCEVENLAEGDHCDVDLKGNAIKNVGQTKTEITGLSNPNYKLGVNSIVECYLTVIRARLAYWETFDYDYDGFQHTGVIGQYITREGEYQKTNVKVIDEKVVAYECKVKPIANYAWEDGTFDEKIVYWYIFPIEDAEVFYSDMLYTYEEVQGVYAYNTVNDGTLKAKDVGTYTAKIRPKDNHAWKDTATVETRTIVWKIIDSSAVKPFLNQDVYVYNGQYQQPEININVMSDWYTITGTTKAINANIGGSKYKITCSLKDKVNMHWDDGSTDDVVLEWVIVPKDVGVRYSKAGNTWTYDRTEKSGNATLTGICTNVTTGALDNCVFTYSNNKRTNQGEQTFKITGTTNSNYRLSSSYDTVTSGDVTTMTPTGDNYVYDITPANIEFNMKINRRIITYNWHTTTWTYDTYEHAVAPTVTNVCPGDTCNIYVSNNKRTEYGTQTVTMTGVSNDNYILPSPAPTCTLKINRNPSCSYTVYNPTYNGSTQTGVSYTSNIVDKLSGNNTGVNAGNYSVTLKPKPSPSGIYNYCWAGTTDDIGERTISWTMNRQKTASYSVSNKTYNGSWQQAVYEGSHSKSLGGDYGATNARTYTASLYLENENYAWTDGSTASPRYISWTMNKAAGKCTAPTARSLTYNGSAQQLINAGSSSTGTMRYKLSGGSWTTSASNITATNAGTYTVYYQAQSSTNYNATSQKSITVTIKRSPTASYAKRKGTAVYEKGLNHSAFSALHNVDAGGDWMMIDAGTYTATVTPKANYAWSDGSYGTVSFTWKIKRSPTAKASVKPTVKIGKNVTTATIISVSKHVKWSGDYEVKAGMKTGTYTAYAKPTSNYAWSDGSTSKRPFTWRLVVRN